MLDGWNGEQLVSLKQFLAITSWSRSSVYRKLDEDDFPKRVRLGAQRIAFKASDVRRYLDSLAPRD